MQGINEKAGQASREGEGDTISVITHTRPFANTGNKGEGKNDINK